jgi:hypothetical protein
VIKYPPGGLIVILRTYLQKPSTSGNENAMKNIRILLLIASLVPFITNAQEIVFQAKPKARVSSGPDKTNREILTESQKNEFKITITKTDDEYYWTTRGNKQLYHSISGAYHIFSATDGSGYIKIFDSQFLPESMRDSGPRFSYIEHMHLGLVTISYWGGASDLSP